MDIKGRRKRIQHCKVGSGYACKKRLSFTMALLGEVSEISPIFFKNNNNNKNDGADAALFLRLIRHLFRTFPENVVPRSSQVRSPWQVK